MTKNIKVAVVGVVIVVLVAAMTVLDTKVYEVEQEQVDTLSIEKIESDKGIVALDSFDTKPTYVKFISEDLIEIDGHHTTFGQGVFQVDLTQLTVKQVEGQVNPDPDLYIETLYSPLGLILTHKDGQSGLYHQSLDGTLNRISSNFKPSEEMSLKLSDNGEKLIYLVRESEQMATYSLKTNKKKVVPGTLPLAVLDNFDKNVGLSPDGGYFTVFSSLGSYGEHTLNVYGADSGRKYAEEIHGTSPKWSPDGKRLSFIYSGSLTGDALLTDTRVGYIKFPEREIVYFDKVSDSYLIHDEMFWNEAGSSLLYLRQSVTEGQNELRSYNVESGSIYSFNFGSEYDTIPTHVSIGTDKIVMYWSQDQLMQIMDLDGVALSQKERIDTIGQFSENTKPYSLTNAKLVFYRENKLIVQNDKTRELLKIDGLKETVVSPESNWIVVGVGENERFELKIVSKK